MDQTGGGEPLLEQVNDYRRGRPLSWPCWPAAAPADVLCGGLASRVLVGSSKKAPIHDRVVQTERAR